MGFYRRRLPHWHALGQPLFVTCRLHGSLPAERVFRAGGESGGRVFVAMDRLLDEGRWGPQFLRRAEVAEMVAEAIRFGAERLEQYELHGFAVMPNHMHLLLSPRVEARRLLQSLKGITGRRGNVLVGRSGGSFWQGESFDRLVRDEAEFGRILHYIEQNPVKAGLVGEAEEYRWSSAWGRRS